MKLRKVAQRDPATPLNLYLEIEIVDFAVGCNFARRDYSPVCDQLHQSVTAQDQFLAPLAVQVYCVPYQTATSRRSQTAVGNGEWNRGSESHLAMDFNRA